MQFWVVVFFSYCLPLSLYPYSTRAYTSKLPSLPDWEVWLEVMTHFLMWLSSSFFNFVSIHFSLSSSSFILRQRVVTKSLTHVDTHTNTRVHTKQTHTCSPWQQWCLWSPALCVAAGFVSADRNPLMLWEPLWPWEEPGSEFWSLQTAAWPGQRHTNMQ